MKKILIAVILVIIGLTCEFEGTKVASNPDTYQYFTQKLDEKRTTVLELTTSATAASLAIGAVPGDATTPIAEKIMDMAGYLVIVLCTIVMEKYLLTLTGWLAFKILFPVACVLALLFLFSHAHFFHRLAIRITMFGLMIIFIVPASVVVTGLIEKTYQDSINATIQKTKDVTSEAEKETAETAEVEESTEEVDTKEGLAEAIDKIKNYTAEVKENLQDTVSDKVDSVTSLSDEVITKAEDMINDFIETIVVMLVTSCVIPMLVLICFIWVAKTIVGADFDWERKQELKETIRLSEKIKNKAEKEAEE